jgi:hypothetical protein
MILPVVPLRMDPVYGMGRRVGPTAGDEKSLPSPDIQLRSLRSCRPYIVSILSYTDIKTDLKKLRCENVECVYYFTTGSNGPGRG